MAKSKKVEKETRRLMEAVSDLVKKKGDRYKFKSKNKKMVKKVKKQCVHWLIRKNKEHPVTVSDNNHPGNWRCTVCGAIFPIKPAEPEDYDNAGNHFLAYVNQMVFWSVKLGGDAEDTKMFIRLRKDIPRFQKVAKHITKAINKRREYESNRERTDSLSQFDAYNGFNYKS